MSERKCSFEGCEKIHMAKGYCKKHYARYLRHGSPDITFKEYHGMTDTPERTAWAHIIQRCFNPKSKQYPRYGGRGITMCDKWKNSFSAFYQDMGPKPFAKAQIDRINNDGNYEPDNCRWISAEENVRNSTVAKLDKKTVSRIRKDFESGGHTYVTLSKIYGTSPKNIGHVIRRETWKNV